MVTRSVTASGKKASLVAGASEAGPPPCCARRRDPVPGDRGSSMGITGPDGRRKKDKNEGHFTARRARPEARAGALGKSLSEPQTCFLLVLWTPGRGGQIDSLTVLFEGAVPPPGHKPFSFGSAGQNPKCACV